MKQIGQRVYVVEDTSAEVFEALREITRLQVLIGIPEANAPREDSPINNATIGYLMEFGSPAANIPARAWLVPGVEKVLPKCLKYIEAATQAGFDGDKGKMRQYLNAAGIIGAEGAKNEMRTGNFVPLKPSTIAARHRQRQDAAPRQSEKDYMKFYYQLKDGGASPEQAATVAQEEVGIRPLLNTLELLHSVTYVVRDEDHEAYA
jgi:hypothetical protein